MIQKVIFRQPAVEDIAEAAAWYDAHASGLGEQLIDEILRATRRAQDDPELFRIVHRDGEVRRVFTNRFPYESSSRSSAKRFTFTRSFTPRATIGGGQSDCKRLSSLNNQLSTVSRPNEVTALLAPSCLEGRAPSRPLFTSVVAAVSAANSVAVVYDRRNPCRLGRCR
jgi:hypothetical protein